jgi:hypothetical protein
VGICSAFKPPLATPPAQCPVPRPCPPLGQLHAPHTGSPAPATAHQGRQKAEAQAGVEVSTATSDPEAHAQYWWVFPTSTHHTEALTLLLTADMLQTQAACCGLLVVLCSRGSAVQPRSLSTAPAAGNNRLSLSHQSTVLQVLPVCICQSRSASCCHEHLHCKRSPSVRLATCLLTAPPYPPTTCMVRYSCRSAMLYSISCRLYRHHGLVKVCLCLDAPPVNATRISTQPDSIIPHSLPHPPGWPPLRRP